MTNAQIIFSQSMKLMEDGKIGTTGRTLTLVAEDGTKSTVNEPEAIHTFAEWKKLGYFVNKGEKAIARFTIWNYSKGKANKLTAKEAEALNKGLLAGNPYKEGDEVEGSGHYYMKEACFFTINQTTAAQKMLPAVI